MCEESSNGGKGNKRKRVRKQLNFFKNNNNLSFGGGEAQVVEISPTSSPSARLAQISERISGRIRFSFIFLQP